MKKDKSSILPYCKICGKYKGLGPCNNPQCVGESTESSSYSSESGTCVICGDKAVKSCENCKKEYCAKHAKNHMEETLVSLDQYLGTCIVCGKVICEQCWIFNEKGLVTCLEHTSKPTHHD